MFSSLELMEDAYLTGLSETPVCECGFDRESAGHFLLCCTRYKEARTELSETVSDILESVKGRKQLTESLLLANMQSY